MTGSWGMNPEPLHTSGGHVRDLKTDASTASKGFLDSVTDAGSAVVHPVLKGALDTYHGTWSGTANRLPVNVDAAGSQIQGAAVTGVQGDQQTAQDQAPALSETHGQAPVVRKMINL